MREGLQRDSLAWKLLNSVSMANRAEPSPDRLLPKHVRFARVLALASGAAVGIAIGATVFTASGCMTCTGICGDSVYGVRPPTQDAAADTRFQDAATDGPGPDRLAPPPDAAVADGHGGGGPTYAPALPADWLV